MFQKYNVVALLKSVATLLFDVFFFWWLRLYNWWTQRLPKDLLLEALGEARIFEEWEAAAFQLDEVLGFDLWRQNPTSKHYDYRLIYERLQAIIEAREEDDILSLVNLLRSGLVRNLGNITAPRLFNRAFAGTKLLIEDYITQVALAVEHVTAYPTSPGLDGGLTNQAKLDVLHDTRQAFGRSALVLQGGAIFGLCHLGVVKALHLRGLLPRIIAGTATGALIAALVGVKTEDELLDSLTGEAIDLSAFSEDAESEKDKANGAPTPKDTGYIATLLRRSRRLINEGYFLDIGVLERCVRANVGDLTFEEAYAKTKRVLNITISTTGNTGIPSLLNYLTAPNVLIWSAALASNATSSTFYAPVTLQCKSPDGSITPWTTPSTDSVPSSPISSASAGARSFSTAATIDSQHPSPLTRIAELFNVNHFIVSQARPYLAPFLRSDTHHPNPRTDSRFTLLTLPLLRLAMMELQHRLLQLDQLSLLPSVARRFLLDENIPGASVTLVPELSLADLARLLESPTPQSVNAWILRGERSVWPAIGALKVRCAVEVELDRGYQVVRRRKPFDPATPGMEGKEWGAGGGKKGCGKGEARRRARAASFGALLRD
ncbi:hypothetical protein NA57DRAFT_79901 [Rhizodiscina lignyota]|uniref:PNPLA domain-containing protein n=1 Tax=Rhizodiscina lignyota TaxID=1504668 RepID=A0A9P4I7T6_9PEZI|nr:hypothetical protein NA57DRAFT_79901 [Rhizodiscina lignyota]